MPNRKDSSRSTVRWLRDLLLVLFAVAWIVVWLLVGWHGGGRGREPFWDAQRYAE